MSVESITESDADAEPTKGEMLETMRGMQARIEQLEDEKDELQQQVDDLEHNQKNTKVSKDEINLILGSLVGMDHIDMTADVVENRDVVADIRERIESLESQTAQFEELEERLSDGGTEGVSEAWEAIVDQAMNKRNSSTHALPNNRVKLHRGDIVGATGKSEDMCGTYIEWFAADPDSEDDDKGKYKKRGTEYRPYKPPSDGVAQRRKSIVIDLDVWGEDA
ncbi:hypothetical protein Hbl1158_17095 (plasmid) [Halobaculum sp. CBA1158]|uniref:hypothetical protein n=1 Tax=Halobaculum sp. CBA1158 TaxID=2904243 RepID=UPI001F3338B9|nr:hypothetical protein [Halobaculum sp. CBA1158]UIP01719.1 hypothetical protein Hbl1158_17095 [Halobaculum sp. CBA1158]